MHLNIGVIGSGMAGLAVGYLFHRAGHQVTIFESATARGMDAHTISVATETGQGLIDAPLRVMSGTGWRSVLALCQELGVSTFAVDTPISLSWMDQTTWLRTGTWHLGSYSIPTLGALRYLHGDTLRIIRDLARLRSDLAMTTEPKQSENRLPQFSKEQASHSSRETIEEFFIRRKYAPIFWRGFLLPLLGTITTCRMEHLLRYPARDLLLIVRDIIFGKPLRRMRGGTTALVNQLAKNLTFISGASVTKVTEEATPDQKTRVVITNSRGESFTCDRLIVATQANSLSFLGDLCATEQTLLRSIEFDHGELITHTDAALMPRRREDWTPLNYLMDTQLEQNMFTVWVNPVEPTIAQSQPVFQSWNSMIPLRPECILSRVSLQRAVQSSGTAEVLTKLSQLQSDPERRIYFCGSWAAPGVPLLESAVRSAINIAKQFSIEIPWDPVAPSLAS